MHELGKDLAKQPKNILAVCTGNICRSPMAEGIFRHLLVGRSGVPVSSAGTHALIGNPATDFAIIASAEQGIDISGHRACMLGLQLVRESSIIFCMEPSHVELVLEIDPEAAGRTFNLAEFAEDSRPLKQISDPYGCSLREYRSCFADIEHCVKNFLKRNRLGPDRVRRD